MSILDRILGVWATAAGVSLVFTFFRQYRGRPRYVYVFFLGAWALVYGVQTLRQTVVVPRWALWVIFGLGIVTMLMDSTRRYRETSERLRQERLARLQGADPKPPDDPLAG